ncbi:hypothetical protein [Microbacterium thalli]|uniref:Uncharacterized protein n=1 Tax=Microbacterium thalli TaxID=3027921 RepID=A0ABT5SJV9_9MICO|nr:hypothetical protein [Microbacterium thalli]MDD7963115.1 hypothetical protein [Microbacterium thalli]MDF2916117.1 hypothetical protein [Microbacterium sp.]
MSLNIRELVEAQVADKIAKGEALERSIAHAEEAAAALEEAQRGVTSARKDALAAGWTENELKRLGLASATPARRRRKSNARPAEQQALGGDQVENDDRG